MKNLIKQIISKTDYKIKKNKNKMSKFKKYNSLTNHYVTKSLMIWQAENKIEGLWNATEKIHGSNMNWTYDYMTNELRMGKRSGFIQKPESFNRSDLVWDKYSEEIRNFCKNEYPGKDVILYGEIFGGYYPDMVAEGSRIQKEVIYTNKTEFALFDVFVEDCFIPWSLVEEKLKKYRIFHVPSVSVDRLENLMKLDNEFNSTIPDLLNKFHNNIEGDEDFLISLEDNCTEGFVLKPETPENMFGNGGKRIALKMKNEKFKEKHSDNSKPRVKKELTENVLTVFNELSTYVTEQRLANVLSKREGEFEMKFFGQVLGEFVMDCLNEFLEEGDENMISVYNDLVKLDKKTIKKSIGGLCQTILKNYGRSEGIC